MALDVFSSLRSTALVTLVAASFSSPIILRSDAVASVTGKLGGERGGHEVAPPDRVLAGGIEFDQPASWDALGASASERGADEDAIGTVVAGLCPGGSSGATCADGTQLTFVAYTGEAGHELPLLSEFRDQLDHQLGREFPGFAAGESKQLPAVDGIRYLDYSFTWGRDGAARAHQRVAAYRHPDGSGVVVMASGPRLQSHEESISEFLAGAHEPVDGH